MIPISEIAEDQILFFDIETTHQYASYTDIRLIGVKYGFDGKYERVHDWKSKDKFKYMMEREDVLKVGFNNLSFDNVVLHRHGYNIEEKNCHDGYLMMKTLAPTLPSYSMKFINFWYFGDPHFPEMEMEAWKQRTLGDWTNVPQRILAPYLAHDLEQTKNVFCLAWEHIQKEPHWSAYNLDLSQGIVIREMETEGGIYIDRALCKKKIAILQKQKADYEYQAYILSDGRVENPNSSRQLGAYLDTEGFALELSANGSFAVRKSDLVDLREKHPVAECAYQVRRINGNLKYFENYIKAVEHEVFNKAGWIPTSYSISNARTRRYTSSSLYGLNFQNPNEEAKSVQYTPPGWLGWWIDSTQVENVVHIFESEDHVRRRAYEADHEWSEYVWLCNRILGGIPRTKAELDAIQSPQIPNWSIYKQYKTVKLALNFGMGVRKFCKTTGVSKDIGQDTFDKIHEACPAIHQLQEIVKRKLQTRGFVQDPFGHIYSGQVRQAYKVVAWLVQGCGTGSLPKAQMRLNYETIHQFDRPGHTYGYMCSTTHDENAGRLSLELGFDKIFAILQELMRNMTSHFSPLFDNIPLRAKLYIGQNHEHIEVNITDREQIRRIVEADHGKNEPSAVKKIKTFDRKRTTNTQMPRKACLS